MIHLSQAPAERGMDPQDTRRRRTAGAYRLLSVMLTTAGFWTAAPSPALADVSTFRCHSAGLALGRTGEQRLEHFDDGHGHDVELWCVRGVFTAHFDLRIGWNDPSTAGIHRMRSIAGCFFNDGQNDGPDLSRDANGAFSKVEWTNHASPPDNASYRFSYDYNTSMVTITATASCHPPMSKIVAPQPNIDRLEALLPKPSGGSCPSKASMDNPGAGG